jgi:hypothetical protein
MKQSSFLLLSLISIAYNTFAQNRSDTNTNRQVIVGQKYVPILIDAYKIESVPVLTKPDIKAPVFSYQIKSKQVETAKIVNPIPAADLFKKEETIYPSSYVKLGYGNYKTPLAEIYLNNAKNKQYSYGAHYRLLQTNSNLNQGFADFTDQSAKGYIRTYNDFGEFGLEANFRQNNYNFYGFNRDSFNLEKKDISRILSTFDAKAYFNSTPNKSGKVKHRTSFNFYNFQIGAAKENQYALKSKIYGNISDFNDLENGVLSADIGLDYNTFKEDSNKLNRLFIQFDPRFDFIYDGLKISAGFNATVLFNGNDTALPFINPVIKATYPLIENAANIYAGIDGRYHKQSLRNIIQSNPFVNTYDLTNTFDNIKLFAGFNAKVGSSADAVFEINYADISNMPLFISKGDSLNSFGILYRQVNMLKFSGTFNYSFSERVRIGVSGNFYDYNVTGEQEAWQMPNIDGKISAKFNIKNKFYPYFDFVAMGLQKQRTGFVEATKQVNSINAFYDISTGFDFRFKKKLSVFVQANNLMASRYQRWYNYPVLGLNILGGITLLF